MRRSFKLGAAIAVGGAVLMAALYGCNQRSEPLRVEAPSPYERPAPADPNGRLWPTDVPAVYPENREAVAEAVRNALWDPAGIRWRDLVTVACRDQTYKEFMAPHEVVVLSPRILNGKAVYLRDLAAPDDAVTRWESADNTNWTYTMVWPTPEHSQAVGVIMVTRFQDTGTGWCYAGPAYATIFGQTHADSFERGFQEIAGGGSAE